MSSTDSLATVTVRAIRATDLGHMREFVQHLSRHSAYLRLLSPRTPTEDEMRHWTDVDGEHEFALVATVAEGEGERQVGVARYVKEPGSDAAEFAIVLADDWQGRGLGRELLVQLIDAAARHGVQRLFGVTLSENRSMVALARKLGFRTRRSPESAMLMVVERDLA